MITSVGLPENYLLPVFTFWQYLLHKGGFEIQFSDCKAMRAYHTPTADFAVLNTNSLINTQTPDDGLKVIRMLIEIIHSIQAGTCHCPRITASHGHQYEGMNGP